MTVEVPSLNCTEPLRQAKKVCEFIGYRWRVAVEFQKELWLLFASIKLLNAFVMRGRKLEQTCQYLFISTEEQFGLLLLGRY